MLLITIMNDVMSHAVNNEQIFLSGIENKCRIMFKISTTLYVSLISSPFTLYFLSVIVLAFGTVFWTTGTQWKMYSFWMGVAVVNTQLGKYVLENSFSSKSFSFYFEGEHGVRKV